MLRKNISAVVSTILSALLFIIIGSCFSAFMYKSEIVKVENPKLIVGNGISVFDDDGKKQVSSLELSKMKLGLKPATGEEDSETKVPITITDKQGSEGQYAKFKVYSPSGAKLIIKDIKIDKKIKENKIEEERENIKVAIKEINNSIASFKENEIKLCDIPASEEKQLFTFYIWLTKDASDILESSIISFNLYFENAN